MGNTRNLLDLPLRNARTERRKHAHRTWFFCLLPLLLGILLEYLCCRLPRRRIWRALPPVLALVFAAAVGVGRWNMWEDETVSPLTQLVLFPGLPAVFLLLGCYLGWRLWKYLWTPRIIRPR